MGESFLVKRGGIWMKPSDALLRVQAPANSSVIISKGTVTMTDGGHEKSDDNTQYIYCFAIPNRLFDSENPWTITATLGTETKSRTVIIDSADDYFIEILYRFYIYSHGNQYVAFGSIKEKKSGVTFGDDYISTWGSQDYGVSQVHTTAKVDIPKYNSLVFEMEYNTNANGNYPMRAGASSSNSSSPSWATVGTLTRQSGVLQTLALDISNLIIPYFVVIRGNMGIKVYSIYMEQ